MDAMKSAFERAMERVENIGEASEQEKKRWKYIPEGQRLAARYLKNEGDLVAELNNYEEEAKRIVSEGVEEVLLKNIDLPLNDVAKKNCVKSMEAINLLKKDKAGLNSVYDKMNHIFSHYEKEGEQQKRQAYERFRQDFHAKMQQAYRQQTGMPMGANVNVEGQPQFHEEWRRILAQLNSQYYNLLEEYKQEIKGLK